MRKHLLGTEGIFGWIHRARQRGTAGSLGFPCRVATGPPEARPAEVFKVGLALERGRIGLTERRYRICPGPSQTSNR
jgi:hypothetical protein